uniref:Brevinin-1SHd n=1 Tax=Pelophylax saharicus TaxID=70019 RepID=D5GRW9_PELSA|nr:brevinin-1SHd precursor [Pelophylax saharicus]
MLFYLPISVSSSRRDANDDERRDDPDESDVEVEKRFLPMLAGLAANFLPKIFCKITRKC